MNKPKYKRGDVVLVPPFGMGVIINEPEWEEDRFFPIGYDSCGKGEWTYSISFNRLDTWGWFGESEITDEV